MTESQVSNKNVSQTHHARLLERHEGWIKMIREISFFQSEFFVPDTKFNSQHLLSYWVNHPSPPAFHVKPGKSLFEKLNANDEFRTLIGKAGYRVFTREYYMVFPYRIPLLSLVELVGMESEPLQKFLVKHSQSLYDWQAGQFSYNAISILLQKYVLSLKIGQAVFFTAYVIALAAVVAWLNSNVIYFYIIFLYIPTYVIAILILLRLSSRSMTRKYVESLCVRELFFILMELKNEEILTDGDSRTNLQYRLDRLARMTPQLSVRFPVRNPDSRRYSEQQFRNMANFIREKERVLVFPTASSLETLCKDFSTLTRIYITGNYGEFIVQYPNSVAPERPEGRVGGFLKGSLRLLGLAIPLALMGIYLWKPDLLPALTLDSKVITTMFIGWLLLGIDNIFGLGVVKDFLSISKGIRDLG